MPTRRPRQWSLARAAIQPAGPPSGCPARCRPGLYLILIFDGSEGGQHYTWDYFQVLGAPRPAARPPREPDRSPAEGVLATLGGALFAFGLGALSVTARRTGP